MVLPIYIHIRKSFSDKDNDSIEAAFQLKKAVKLPVGPDKLFEADIAQREYYPGTSKL